MTLLMGVKVKGGALGSGRWARGLQIGYAWTRGGEFKDENAVR